MEEDDTGDGRLALETERSDSRDELPVVGLYIVDVADVLWEVRRVQAVVRIGRVAVHTVLRLVEVHRVLRVLVDCTDQAMCELAHGNEPDHALGTRRVDANMGSQLFDGHGDLLWVGTPPH